MKHFFTTTIKQSSGFTLIETIIAIFILTATVGALLTVTANGFYSARYAQNQIVADNLIQEALEYVRNDRDNKFLNESMSGYNGSTNYSKWYTLKNSFTGCLTANGCIVDIYSTGAHYVACGTTCPVMRYFEDKGIYGYGNTYPFSTANAYDTSFIRTIKMTSPNPTASQVTVTATVRWKNGSVNKSTSQTIFLSDWRSMRP